MTRRRQKTSSTADIVAKNLGSSKFKHTKSIQIKAAVLGSQEPRTF
ncbi:hypothetical protein ACEE42_06980 [Streptococcus suis]